MRIVAWPFFDTNPDIANLLAVAHVLGHVDLFKNNIMFANTHRHMINDAVSTSCTARSRCATSAPYVTTSRRR
jgi:spore cortex formation protein SpoVR/YcgB (stage V sporulation)